MSHDNGGPAFPCIEPTMTGISSEGEERWETEAHGGMSLRDYFAAKAMQAAATNPIGADGFTFDERAMWAYQQADAMLKARKS